MAGKPSVAEELVRRMQAAGARPNVIVWTSLLCAYGATRDAGRAEAVLRQMAAAGCRPNGKTYTELMAQLAALGAWGGPQQGRALGAHMPGMPSHLCLRVHKLGGRPWGPPCPGLPWTYGSNCANHCWRLCCSLVTLQGGTRTASATSARCSLVGADQARALPALAPLVAPTLVAWHAGHACVPGCPAPPPQLPAPLALLTPAGPVSLPPPHLHDSWGPHPPPSLNAEGWPADQVSLAILFDSMLHRWAEDRQGRQQLLSGIAERWERAAAGGALEPRTQLLQPQGRLAVDLHGFSPWTAQVGRGGVGWLTGRRECSGWGWAVCVAVPSACSLCLCWRASHKLHLCMLPCAARPCRSLWCWTCCAAC